jgi:hypothetical protein
MVSRRPSSPRAAD